jgi:hypothetical protein
MAGVPEPTHAHPLAQAEPGHPGPQGLDLADDLMARDYLRAGKGKLAVDDVQVGAADPARQDPQPRLAGTLDGIGQLGHPEPLPGTVQHHGAHER